MMIEGLFPQGGQHGEEPEGSGPLPADGNGPESGAPGPWAEVSPEGAGQGLFVCLPAEQMDLSGFAGDGQAAPMAPGPLLAGLAHAVVEGDGAGLAKAPDDYLFAIMSGGRRMASWGTWLELAAMRELAVRHPASQDRTDRQKRAAAESAGGQPAASQPSAPEPAGQDTGARSANAGEAGVAGDAGQAPAGAGSASAGQGSAGQGVADQGGPGQGGAGSADADGRGDFSEFVADEVALELRLTWMGAADRMTYACALAGRLPVTFAALGAGLIDPVHAKIIYEQTDILSAADAARADPVLAAAAQQKTYGEPHGGPGGTGPGGHAHPAGKDTGPVLAALVNLTVPLATGLGQSGTPGEAGGFGLLDAGTARDLLAAAARSPHTRWCVTVLHPDGTAAAHGCAAGRHPAPPGPEPPDPEPPGTASSRTAPPGTANLGTTFDSGSGPGQRPPPETQVQDYLRSLRVRLTPIARGSCDHQQAEKGYQPSRKLRHLVTTRSTRCSAPGCGRPAARCDLDHTVAWNKGGITCECDLSPPCKR